LFSGEVGDCDALLPVEEKERLGTFMKFVFLYMQALLKTFPLDGAARCYSVKFSRPFLILICLLKICYLIEVRYSQTI
jgi:hypothetical protein